MLVMLVRLCFFMMVVVNCGFEKIMILVVDCIRCVYV